MIDKKLINLPFGIFKKFLMRAFHITPYLEMIQQMNHHLQTLLADQQQILTQIQQSLAQTQQAFTQTQQFLTQTHQTLTLIDREQKYQRDLTELLSKTNVFLTATMTDLQTKITLPQSQNWPLITVIMPVWNREALVANAIKSVQAQSYDHWELIIIDDGSTDHTQKIIEPYLNDKRVQYYWQPKSGVNSARNLGLEKSRGKIIAYLDSDNTFFPYTLKITALAFLVDPQCEMAHFAAIWENANDHYRQINFPENLQMEDQIVSKINDNVRGIDANCFVHQRALYENYGGYDIELSRLTEYELIFRYSQYAKIKALPFIGTHYNFCLAKNTITAQNNFWHNLYLIRKKHSLTKRKDTSIPVHTYRQGAACFNADKYFPSTHLKDRKLVLCVGAGLIDEELGFLINIAHRCKTHRFILVFAHCREPKNTSYLAQLNDLNQSLVFPVEIHKDVTFKEIAPLIQQAGIYCHVHLGEDRDEPSHEMPISILEAMATGAYVIARDDKEVNAYIDDKTQLYSTEEEAIKLINDTLYWTEDQWHIIQQRAIDKAYQQITHTTFDF